MASRMAPKRPPAAAKRTCCRRNCSTVIASPARCSRRRTAAVPPRMRSSRVAASVRKGRASASTGANGPCGVTGSVSNREALRPSRRYGATRSSRLGRRIGGAYAIAHSSPPPATPPSSAPVMPRLTGCSGRSAGRSAVSRSASSSGTPRPTCLRPPRARPHPAGLLYAVSVEPFTHNRSRTTHGAANASLAALTVQPCRVSNSARVRASSRRNCESVRSSRPRSVPPTSRASRSDSMMRSATGSASSSASRARHGNERTRGAIVLCEPVEGWPQRQRTSFGEPGQRLRQREAGAYGGCEVVDHFRPDTAQLTHPCCSAAGDQPPWHHRGETADRQRQRVRRADDENDGGSEQTAQRADGVQLHGCDATNARLREQLARPHVHRAAAGRRGRRAAVENQQDADAEQQTEKDSHLRPRPRASRR